MVNCLSRPMRVLEVPSVWSWVCALARIGGGMGMEGVARAARGATSTASAIVAAHRRSGRDLRVVAVFVMVVVCSSFSRIFLVEMPGL